MGGDVLVVEDVFPDAEEPNLFPLRVDIASKPGAALALVTSPTTYGATKHRR